MISLLRIYTHFQSWAIYLEHVFEEKARKHMAYLETFRK